MRSAKTRGALGCLLALCLILSACAAPGAQRPASAEGAAPSAPALTPTRTPDPTPAATPDPAPEPADEPASETAPVFIPEARPLAIRLQAGGPTEPLSDGDPNTVCAFSKGETLAISADEPIGGLYLIWYDRPLPCTLHSGGETVPIGAQGFLHEYVPLSGSERSVVLRLPEEELRIAEIRAFSPGRPPQDVQVWQSPCAEADILLVSTHADDEFIFFGGLLPLYAAERGLAVQVVYTISHYNSLRVRCHEMLDALWLAGIRRYPVVNDAPDREIYSLGDAEWIYGKDGFADFLVEQIRRFRPLVIVTHDEKGEYKQGCHMLTAMSLEKAVVLAADAGFQPESAERWGLWDTPKTYLHLFGPEDERTVLDYETPLGSFGGKTALAVAEEAFALHVSQQSLHFRIYERGHAYDSHSFGLFRSLVGPDLQRDDLMENLDPAAWHGRGGDGG